MWDWRGRLKIGAYTAELGKCNDRPGLEEVGYVAVNASPF